MKKLIIHLLVIFTAHSLFGQFQNPEAGKVFEDQAVHRVDIIITQTDLDQLLAEENWYSDVEYPATFVFDQEDTVDNIGFRLRGNTSRSSAKKSFKISFNTFESGGDYKGLEKLNLNGEHNDPNIMRAKLIWDAARSGGLAAPRSNFVDLYINQEYRGLYLNVEHLDEEFVESRFGNKDGNLYKCLWPADLTYRGTDPEEYKFESSGRRAYDLKTNVETDDYSDLAHFIDVLNNTPDTELPEALEKIFDVNTYLKTVALEMLAGHWDSYTYLKNNYYLYSNPKDGKIQYLAYDTDNTLGIDWIGRDWATRDIYDWANHGEARPLYERLIAMDDYKDRLSYFVNEWISGPFSPSTLNDQIDQIKVIIDASVRADEYRTLDWGFSYDSYLNAFDQALGGHVSYGLKAFITARTSSAQNQLRLHDIAPIIWQASLQPIVMNQPLSFTMIAEDEDAIVSEVHYKINDGSWTTMALDETGELEFYLAELDFPEGLASLEYYFEVSDGQGQTSRYPRSENLKVEITSPGEVSLVINELMAVNDQTIQDEAGEFNDWIELYNAGTSPVWLGDKYLSDKADNPGKWQLPDLTLSAGEFLLIWADEDGDQGKTHANFKLSGDGEFLRLGFGAEAGFQLIDSITYGALNADQAFGRIPDGTGPFIKVGIPTPGSLNLYDGITTGTLNVPKLLWYPNPTTDLLTIDSNLKIKSITILSLEGKLLQTLNEPTDTISLGFLNPGIYLIRSQTEEGMILLQRILLK